MYEEISARRDRVQARACPPSLVLVGHVVSVRLYRREDWSVVEVEGDLDVQSISLRRRILAASGPWMVFDLCRVAFMDASGLALLVAARLAATRDGGVVRVAGAPTQVRKLLTITHLDRGIAVFDTLGEALAAPLTSTDPC